MKKLRKKQAKETAFQIMVSAGITALILQIFFAHTIPQGIVPLWKTDTNILEVIDVSKYWLIFVVVTNTLISLLVRKYLISQEKMTWEKVFSISLYAGITEEIGFRWFMFLNAIVGVQIVNLILGGFLGGPGLTEILFERIMIPIANWSTLGIIQDQFFYLYPGHQWLIIGTSILIVAAKFRDGHAYQGCLGWINSWFMGIFMFYITFNYGLVAAIFIHVLYDIVALGTALVNQHFWIAYYDHQSTVA